MPGPDDKENSMGYLTRHQNKINHGGQKTFQGREEQSHETHLPFELNRWLNHAGVPNPGTQRQVRAARKRVGYKTWVDMAQQGYDQAVAQGWRGAPRGSLEHYRAQRRAQEMGKVMGYSIALDDILPIVQMRDIQTQIMGVTMSVTVLQKTSFSGNLSVKPVNQKAGMELTMDASKGAVSSAMNVFNLSFSGWDQAKGFMGLSSTITGKDGTQSVVTIEKSEYDVGTLTASVMARVAGFKRVVKTACCDAEVSGDFFIKFQLTAMPRVKYEPSFAHEFWNQLLLDLGSAGDAVAASGLITFAVAIGKAVLDSPKAPIPVLVPRVVVPVIMDPARDKGNNNT